VERGQERESEGNVAECHVGSCCEPPLRVHKSCWVSGGDGLTGPQRALGGTDSDNAESHLWRQAQGQVGLGWACGHGDMPGLGVRAWSKGGALGPWRGDGFIPDPAVARFAGPLYFLSPSATLLPLCLRVVSFSSRLFSSLSFPPSIPFLPGLWHAVTY
jgi:hypothetical protein